MRLQRLLPFQKSAVQGSCVVMGISPERLILVAIDRQIPFEFLTIKQASQVLDWVRRQNIFQK